MGKEKVLSVLNGLWPKKDVILFNSFPDLNGNALAVYEYILRERPDLREKYALIWALTDLSEAEAVRILSARTGVSSHLTVDKKSPNGILRFLQAKYLVTTHGYFPSVRSPRGQIDAKVWHGMPFKRVGRLLENDAHTSGSQDVADCTEATSVLYQDIMMKVFGIPREKVFLTGQPCNDFFADNGKGFSKMVPDASSFSKVLIWLPTYRRSVVGDIRVDGPENSFGVSTLLSAHFDELDAALKQRNILMLIKPHPMDVLCRMTLPTSRHIRVIHNADLSAAAVQLYEFLSGCDVLMTDYSSVFIDFLVTGKPIAFVCDDLEEFGGNRGFCFDPPRDYMPGELIPDYDALIRYLDHMDEINAGWDEKRREITRLFNPMNDHRASERVCDILWPRSGQEPFKK